MILRIAIVIGTALLFFYLPRLSLAHDHNHPELDAWYRTLRSDLGPCCGGPDTDATELAEEDWKTKGDHYQVFLKGIGWTDVPNLAVVKEPNLAGGAKVWLYKGVDGETHVRCFLPGSLT